MATQKIQSDYRRALFLSMIFISLGCVLLNTIALKAIGIVFIAVGGFFFIVGMVRRKNGRTPVEK